MNLELQLGMTPIGESILLGNFDEVSLNPDEQVQMINGLVKYLDSLDAPSAEVDDGTNQLILWLGGLDRNIMLYGIQLIQLYYEIDFEPDEKAEQRIEAVAENMPDEGYEADSLAGIQKFKWEREKLTFDEMLDNAAEWVQTLLPEADDTILTPDMILSGQWQDLEITYDMTTALISETLQSLKDQLNGNPPNILYWQRLNHFLEWLMTLQPELAIMGVRSAMLMWNLPFGIGARDNLPAWKTFVQEYKSLMIKD